MKSINRITQNFKDKDRPFCGSRRDFIKNTLLASALAAIPVPAISSSKLHRASYYQKMPENAVRCILCPRKCIIHEGKIGYCGVRANDKGTLYSLSYGQPCSIHADPIEKKPFFHVLPGTRSLSISTVGCNLECKFCQNWQISQSKPDMIETRYRPSESIVSLAANRKLPSITFTYGEPVVFLEYAIDIAAAASSRNIRSFAVTNGYYNRGSFRDLLKKVDAVKIDLKAFTDSYYRDICAGTLKPVLDSITETRKEGVWLEIVYLMIPALNDSPEDIRRMAEWLVRNVGDEVPVHFSRFFPRYRLKNLPPTPLSSLERGYKICRDAGMKFVYIGNFPGRGRESTYCPECGNLLIERNGYRIRSINMKGAGCGNCGEAIPGIWNNV